MCFYNAFTTILQESVEDVCDIYSVLESGGWIWRLLGVFIVIPKRIMGEKKYVAYIDYTKFLPSYCFYLIIILSLIFRHRLL